MPPTFNCLANGCTKVFDSNISLRRHYKQCEPYKLTIGQAHELHTANAAAATKQLSSNSWRNSPSVRGSWVNSGITRNGSTSKLAPVVATFTAPVATSSGPSIVMSEEPLPPATGSHLGDITDDGLMDIDDVEVSVPLQGSTGTLDTRNEGVTAVLRGPTGIPLPPGSHQSRPSPPRLGFTEDVLPQPLRRLVLFVRDKLTTDKNVFGLWREYLHRPSFDPDSFVPPENLAKKSQSYDDPLEPPAPKLNLLGQNKSWGILLSWANTGSQMKSEQEMNRLAEALQDEDFDPKELKGLTAQRAAREMDKEDANSSLLSKFQEASISIDVPSGSTTVPPKTVNIPGLHYRPLCSLIRSAFAHPLAAQYHFTPYRLFHTSPQTGKTQRVFSELYDSDVFIEEHDRVQRARNPPDDPHCKREKVIAAMMLWSDSTHLADFGTAKLWPVYMALGNLSKYVRSLPNSGALHHVAYIPSLPDSFQDDLKTWHSKWSKASQRKEVTAHCRRELMHAVWRFLLDKDFQNAYKYGMVIKCLDGIERRVYPRIFTYSADYPEKVLLATIRDKGLCLCPRCLVPRSRLHLMGQALDFRRRVTEARVFLWDKVKHARDWIYKFGKGIKSTWVEDQLKETSSVPTVNAFSERLGQSFSPPQEFPLGRMLVPDFMHEFELGVWKTLFTHIIRVLWAKTPDGSSVLKLNDRFRQVPPFGTDTIRRFTTDTSEMKKLAARDFEDILQCSIPVFDGLLPDEGENRQLLRLLYRTAEFHAFAKLRYHTEDTVEHLTEATTAFGKVIRQFKDEICESCETVELPSEAARRVRRAQSQTAGIATNNQEAPATQARRPRELNLSTYKFHSLGDYPAYIRMFGPSDGYSTQVGELAHRLVKRLYGLTNKRKVAMQIGRRVERLERARLARDLRLKHEKLRHVVHRVSLSKGRSTESPEDSSSGIFVQDRSFQFHMSDSQNHPVDIFDLTKTQRGNPAYKDFRAKLQDHLLGRKLGRAFDGDNHDDFSDEDRNTLHIYGEKIYQVGTCTFNFTTYDNRRDFDVVNPTSRPDVMVRSQEDNREEVPFWHARVIGIYHAKVSTTHKDVRPQDRGVERMSFLFVRWLGAEPGYRFGFDKARLPKVGFVPYNDEVDNFAFGFLDPSQVLRGCHLIPNFRYGRTSDLLPYPCAVARQLDDDALKDWETFYVNIFVDRDMVMRYYGGGVGHLDQIEVCNEGGGQASMGSNDSEGDPANNQHRSLPISGSDDGSDGEAGLEYGESEFSSGSEDSEGAGDSDDDDDGRYASD